MPVEVLKMRAAVATARRVVARWDDRLHAADDRVQDTALRAPRSLHRCRTGSNASAWVRAITYHLAVDGSRRRRRAWAFRIDLRNVLTGGSAGAANVVGGARTADEE